MQYYLYRIDSGSYRARSTWRAHIEGLDGEVSLCGRAPMTVWPPRIVAPA